jgi:acetylornithine deacetylase
MNIEASYQQAVNLLKELIRNPSFSKEEGETAQVLIDFFQAQDITVDRLGNNIIVKNLHFDEVKPTILLNSHHDTVKPNTGYSLDPFKPNEKDGKLFGLGSNDAGGALVSLTMTFLHFYNEELPYNLILVASAEEEISGSGGIESILSALPTCELAIVGEPTEMHMAVAEKGLMVLDCYAKGESGHAARDIGINAIYESLSDIEWFRTYQFDKISKHLGPVKMTVTQINSGTQHNVIPDSCHFVVDVRSTDSYSNAELLKIISDHVKCEVTPRSTRLSPSNFPTDHPISVVADQLGIKKFGSPTLSDQALILFPSFKMGPGKSERSHTADEFIYLKEMKEGIAGYIQLLDTFFNQSTHP